jgi:transposase-like protein
LTAEEQTMKARRSYSDEQKAEALAGLDANAGNVARTARQLSLPRKTLDQWAKGRVHPDVANLRQGKKEALADRLEALALRLADAMPGKIAGASLIQLAVAVGIVIDKMLLLRATASHVGGTEALTDQERLDRLRELAERARRRSGVPDPARAGGGSDHRMPQTPTGDSAAGK